MTVGVGKPAVKHLKLTVLPTSMSLASIGGMVMVAGTEAEQIHSLVHNHACNTFCTTSILEQFHAFYNKLYV